jgi:hypothetical protein
MAARATPTFRAWIEPLARFGFAVRGLVYGLVGVLAAAAALGLRRHATDPHGAIRALGREPFGPLLLVAVGLGLAAYAVWRFTQALLDLDGKGSSLQALIARASFLASGLVHAGLAFTAGSLAAGLRHGRSSDPVRRWVDRAMVAPYGRWLVAAAGLAVMASAAYQFYKAYALVFEEELRLARMSARERRWARRILRAGLAARGVTFGVIGWFLVRAALDIDPGEALGMGGALRTIARQDYGPWLLFVVAVGLIAYGVLSLVDARYRRVT